MIFGFDFTPLYRAFAAAWGITPSRARVEVSDDEVRVRFGPWLLRTTISNVSDTEITGQYSIPKTIGPPHLSLADRGITFATNPHAGLCVRLRHAVPAIEPFELIRHPAFTVTVADIDGLHAAMETRRGKRFLVLVFISIGHEEAGAGDVGESDSGPLSSDWVAATTAAQVSPARSRTWRMNKLSRPISTK